MSSEEMELAQLCFNIGVSTSVAVAIVLPSIANVITLSTPEFSKSAIMILDLVTSPSPIYCT